MAIRALKFATDHPYAATGIFGAAVGSAATYAFLTGGTVGQRRSSVFTPKVYEFALTPEDLQRMLTDPSVEIRYETPETVVVVTSEKRVQFKALPDIEG